MSPAVTRSRDSGPDPLSSVMFGGCVPLQGFAAGLLAVALLTLPGQAQLGGILIRILFGLMILGAVAALLWRRPPLDWLGTLLGVAGGAAAMLKVSLGMGRLAEPEDGWLRACAGTPGWVVCSVLLVALALCAWRDLQLDRRG